jgi:hypothetical protein
MKILLALPVIFLPDSAQSVGSRACISPGWVAPNAMTRVIASMFDVVAVHGFALQDGAHESATQVRRTPTTGTTLCVTGFGA